MNASILNIPNSITLCRIMISVTALPLLLIHYKAGIISNNYYLALFYLLLGYTDNLDGQLARRYQQVTLLGKILDPLADKIFLFSTVLALVYLHAFAWHWALIIIVREFIVMGLREIALHHNFSLAVSWTAKVKTYFQVLFFTFAIINPDFAKADILYACLLGCMIFYSLYSAVLYGKKLYIGRYS